VQTKYAKSQTTLLTLLRVAIGWHFLYEGLVKLLMRDWSSAQYLDVSSWIFAPFFHWMAATPNVLAVVDFLNIWGLILVGAALMLGVFTRFASVCGMVMLLFYYLANPPFVGLDFGVVNEGHYLVVNKNMIEFFALAVVLFFPTGSILGFVVLLLRKGSKKSPAKKAKKSNDTVMPEEPASYGRRQMIKALATVPALGAFAYAFAKKKKWQAWEERNLVDAMTSPSTKLFNPAGLLQLKGRVPMAKIKELPISRVILGGNLLSGWAHSRDLVYVSQLVKAYHNKDKIFATLLTAEKCGINTLLTNPILCTVIDEYWKRNIGKIQFISDCAGLNYDKGTYAIPFNEYLDRIKRAIDYGAVACYIQGESADYYMSNNRVDELAKAIQYIRDRGVMVGIGAHYVETIESCVREGFNPDFWMKTTHHHNYWSATAPEWHDNKFDFNPQKTIEYMSSLPQPWIAFKVMAAGAIPPQDGFRYAFENGADIVCAGMYDFQMVEDVNIALDVLNGPLNRKRAWMA
jgi:uncharacterized membrane protein YphA (DoxX/SURF4 family)